MKRVLNRDSLKGVTTYWHEDPVTKQVTLEDVQDVEPTLELNKILQKETQDKRGDFWHAATVPEVFLIKWAREAGVDVNSKEFGEVLKRKLNDPDFRAFRTGIFQV